MNVNYSKELRNEAKRKKTGLATIDFVTPKGSRFTTQGLADDTKIKLISDFISKLDI